MKRRPKNYTRGPLGMSVYGTVTTTPYLDASEMLSNMIQTDIVEKLQDMSVLIGRYRLFDANHRRKRRPKYRR